MSDADRLTPASSEDLADTLAFALRYNGCKRTHDAAEMMAATSPRRLVEQTSGAHGFVVMKKPADRRRRERRAAWAAATPAGGAIVWATRGPPGSRLG